jgi:hypothetical protein
MSDNNLILFVLNSATFFGKQCFGRVCLGVFASRKDVQAYIKQLQRDEVFADVKSWKKTTRGWTCENNTGDVFVRKMTIDSAVSHLAVMKTKKKTASCPEDVMPVQEVPINCAPL